MSPWLELQKRWEVRAVEFEGLFSGGHGPMICYDYGGRSPP
jgi:hypothetical protein